MEKVLVVAKTHMSQGKACIGGLNLRTFENVRLKLPGERNHPAETPFDVGQVWNLELRNVRDTEPPHVEDVIVSTQNYVHSLPSLLSTLIENVHPWQGGLTQLFDGYLQGDGNKAFISRKGGVPLCSTGYWLPTMPLTHALVYGKDCYMVSSLVHKGQDLHRATFSIPYVGFAEPLPEIPAHTLVRVSMCRWFRREDYSEERCYLQISGWYL